MSNVSQFLGRLAAATQIIFAILLGMVASFRFEPGFLPRGEVIVCVFALPGLIGLLGIRARRPALLVAAGLASGIGSFTAFSGVTLIFLIPSLLFLFGAARLGAGRGAERGGWISAGAQLALAVAIVPSLVGAGAAGLLVTDAACWTAFPSPIGTRVEILPYTNGPIELTVPGSSMECAQGLISARGVGLAALLDGAAIGMALVAARRRRVAIDQVANGRVGGS
jgi:hypothetical protein